MSSNRGATERYLPYKIKQCYLPPTQVKALRYNPSQAGQYLSYLTRSNGRPSWTWCWLYTA